MTDRPAQPSVGVVGSGVMGSGIAQTLAIASFRVVCTDRDRSALGQARERIRSGRHGLDRAVRRGILSATQAGDTMERLEFTTELGHVASCDVVIEAIPEDLGAKVDLFRELDKQAPATTILCSNSSGLPIAALAAATGRRDRVLGWHWASPAPVMALAEIVRTEWTSDHVVDAICDMARHAGKNPVVVNDTAMAWGYVANRVYAAMFREAQQVVREGVATEEQVDALLVDCYRWPTGPFAVARRAVEGWTTDSGDPGQTPTPY